MPETREEKEIRRGQAIIAAVAAADKIILDCSDGSVEETEYITAAVAEEFAKKAFLPFGARLLKKDIDDEYNRTPNMAR
ncbi:MAG: hypothetical protein PHG23_01710 [Candidatus Pacebacteria bacterium]|nr:hypothetical protein [Candidatus Paceibacterota bacterium]